MTFNFGEYTSAETVSANIMFHAETASVNIMFHGLINPCVHLMESH